MHLLFFQNYIQCFSFDFDFSWYNVFENRKILVSETVITKFIGDVKSELTNNIFMNQKVH